MSSLKDKALQLHSRVEKLIDLNGRVLSEKKVVENENIRLKEENLELKSLVKELEEKIKILKIAGALSGVDGNNQRAKLKINELVREIDKCIALLNR
jgi:hypothetical protein